MLFISLVVVVIIALIIAADAHAHGITMSGDPKRFSSEWGRWLFLCLFFGVIGAAWYLIRRSRVMNARGMNAVPQAELPPEEELILCGKCGQLIGSYRNYCPLCGEPPRQ